MYPCDGENELWHLYDKLNLTGRVIRIGQHAVSGGCANVWEARLSRERSARLLGCADEEGEKVAVKVIREVGSSANEATLKKRLVREVRAWSCLHHRNVLPLYGFTYGFIPGTRLASLISPWMQNGTARQYLEKRSVSERIRVLTGVADGLYYLHRHDVVHGDLKGDNIMIDMHFEPRIADFGLSKLLDEVTSTLTTTNTGNPFGTVRWTAPELFESPRVNFESDIWAFGMTILELFTNAPPFRHLRTDAQVIIKVNKGELPPRPSPSTGMDDAIWDLCCDCWHSNPLLRPSTRVLAKRLWELDLKCKLLARRKRRASPSPERRRDAQGEDGELQRDSEGRLRKSPKLSTLEELASETMGSRSNSVVMPSPVRPAYRSMTQRQRGSRVTSGPLVRTASGSSPSTTPVTELTDGVDPRRLFTNSHSDGDIHAHFRYNPPQQLQRYHPPVFRTQSEPVGLDLSLESQTFDDDLGSELSTALTTPRQDLYHPFETGIDPYSDAYTSFTPPDHQPLIMDSSNDLHLIEQSEFLGGYDADIVHPSQWTSSYPPDGYTRAAFIASFPQQDGCYVFDDMHSIDAQHHAPPLLLPPPPPPSDFGSFTYGNSPSMENSFPSPHALGHIFSENFVYEDPQQLSPYPSPLLLNEPLSDPPPPLHPYAQQQNHQQQLVYHAPHQPSAGRVDFASLQYGIISPALSDISTPDSDPTPVAHDKGTETPFMGGFGDDFAIGSEDEGEVLEEGLALFGGLDVSGDFDSSRALWETMGIGNGNGNGNGIVDDDDLTPHGSPRQLAYVPPLSRMRVPTQIPPTPRLSPLLSSF